MKSQSPYRLQEISNLKSQISKNRWKTIGHFYNLTLALEHLERTCLRRPAPVAGRPATGAGRQGNRGSHGNFRVVNGSGKPI